MLALFVFQFLFHVTFLFFFFNDTATTEIYTLSLHDALPIFSPSMSVPRCRLTRCIAAPGIRRSIGVTPLFRSCDWTDRKSTRLNSSHLVISYAVFCLKKKKKDITPTAVCSTAYNDA